MHNDVIIDKFSDKAVSLALFGFTNSQIADMMGVTEKVLLQRAGQRIEDGRTVTGKKIATILAKQYIDNLKSE